MFTVCPKCALTLVVTTEDLRVARGYVRCGTCSSVFNALAQLRDERHGSAAAARPAETPPAPAPEPPAGRAARTGGRAATASPAAAPQPAAAPPPPAPKRAPPSTPPAAAAPPAPAPRAPATPPRRADAVRISEPPAASPGEDEVPEELPEPQPDADEVILFDDSGPRRAPKRPAKKPAAPELEDSQVDIEIDTDYLAAMISNDQADPDTVTPVTLGARSAPPQARADQGTAPRAPSEPEEARSRREARATVSPAPPATSAPPSAVARTPTAAVSAPRPAAVAAAAAPTEAAAAAPPAAPAATARAGAAEIAPAAAPRRRAGDFVARRRGTPLRFYLGAGVLLLGLLTQLVNHDRDELAAHERFNRPLTGLYAAFGVKLVPHWDLHAYDVRQLGAAADPTGGGLITVRASIRNAAEQPRPLPLLRVTLQDRFGNRLASGDVAPRFYLPRAVPASASLGAGQRVDAEMVFADPGANAVGFEIDACLPASGGGVTCANDTAAR
jgi:predicted Zn finger-like uncharacterized protein